MTSVDRRTTLKLLAAGAASLSAPFAVARSATDAARIYGNAIVIDGLSFGREWNQTERAALDASGYSGFITSLPRRTLNIAIEALMTWRARIEADPDRFMRAETASDFRRASAEGKVAVLMNFQNATMLEGDAANVDLLHALGTRCFQLTYNRRNRLGDGCTERTDAGLSDFGIAVVRRMNDRGVLIDLSHCGDRTTMDGIAFSDKPVAFTHTMCEALRPGHPRAKTDEQLRILAERGGVAGMAAIGYFVGTDPGGQTTIQTYADHIDHAVEVAGIDHVGLASDFPIQGIAPWATRENWYEPRLRNFKPSYDVRWPPWIPELDGPDRFRRLTDILVGRGYTPNDIHKILGLNWLRLLEETIG